MPSPQESYDDAMFAFSTGDFATAIALLRNVVASHPQYLDARLALSMALFRSGDLQAAISEGHLAEALVPDEQLVHTNLSLFYLKAGDKAAAERHGLKARVASWKTGAATAPTGNGDLAQATEPVVKVKHLPPMREMPWKQEVTPESPSS